MDPSPWPLMAAFGGLALTTGLVLFMHRFYDGLNLFYTGLLLICYVMFVWWRDSVKNEQDIEVKFLKNRMYCVNVPIFWKLFAGS